jgi:UTP:GlnB (protein PII) uridylyltransferase
LPASLSCDAQRCIGRGILADNQFDSEGRAILQKKKNLRLIRLLSSGVAARPKTDIRSVYGGVLVQDADGPVEIAQNVVTKRAPPKGRIRAFALEPAVTINNQWSHRYTMVEITGLDRTGLLYELTATLSKLNLNIASAHVATFGERVVDVFYVTDLMGAQITSPTRQAAIKRALIALFAAPQDDKSAKAST